MNTTSPLILIILDGWGIAAPGPGNAITLSQIPNFNRFWNSFPHTQLAASGEAVGLPPHENGNTETGHLNLGAGHIVYQDLPRINLSIADGNFFNNPAFLSAINHAKTRSSRLHLMGLVGLGTVHSNLDHIFALLRLAKTWQLPTVYLHLFTDGRDSPPNSALAFIDQVEANCHALGLGQIASLTGRYYAMDRDHRWDRTQASYLALTEGSHLTAPDAPTAITAAYTRQETDEFIQPTTIIPDGVIRDNDAVIFFNYRIDRPRQLTKAFVLPDFETSAARSLAFDPYAVKYFKSHLKQAPVLTPFHRQKVLHHLFFATMTEYEQGLPVAVAFPPQVIENPLGRVISEANLSQLRLTETEKERFVTYYFNGQREQPFPGEDRLIIPSPPVATYDLQPEMATATLTQTLSDHLRDYPVIIVNFPSPDMVAHTGNLTATIKACATVDTALGQITDRVLSLGGHTLITADHGNAEELINLRTGAVDTEHSSNPVPFILVSRTVTAPQTLQSGILADVAPTILKLLHLPQPSQMTGRSLL
ncbi:MAG: phosphoglycerate mutase (2,3-diphosphoglycerate-independent) [Candidatus Chisholmbacteria bacterium RIFCSPHIGHO2_01_FULL_48_12]|uniref:2,3-bisphosphoglycerate-independent phosphoglycerate mutase n=1 Tax=Candidatus Chisholmbacteria bacterium RIFCSPHIGHO2_01_FULL_48_12 TaxID=1797589 RepID=A0A1G1VNC5_9BACT|nr:MAG: phosphoglycerate mutase (2,3-diphosphoglycerate-independent) [Candidatus Chisholmbacteria bacterium RIFCSPHIGHO2_01_FULL_48_12]